MLDMAAFSEANRERWRNQSMFRPADCFQATVDALQQACLTDNRIQRLEEGDFGLGFCRKADLLEALAEELADVYIMLDLLCQSVHISLENEVLRRFNITSEAVGFPQLDQTGRKRTA